MPILNYTTKIDATKTIGEIISHLVKHGATKIVQDYEDGLASAITFAVPERDGLRAYSLPCHYERVLRAMVADRKCPGSLCNEEQAMRVSWRIVKDWVEAQMAFVEAGLADMQEVFMPYAILRSGRTMYEELKDGNIKEMRLLGDGK